MDWKFYFIIFLYQAQLDSGNSANILALMGVASPSHHLWNSVLLHELANRGHNLTILSPDLPKSQKNIPANVHYIHLEQTYNSMYSSDSEQDVHVVINDFIGQGGLQSIPNFYEYAIKTCKGMLKSQGLQVLLDYPDSYKFDLVIHDYTIGACLLGFVSKFHYPPLVGVSAFLNPPITTDFIGHHYNPAYIPYHSTTYDVNMHIFHRIHNTVIYLADTLYRRFKATPTLDALARPYFPDMPYLGDLEKRTTLALVNSHPAVNYPEPLPPNVIEIGGMQLTDPKPLPVELEAFIINSKSGAILFSLGTNMKPDDMGDEKIETILETMKQLSEYRFLWKLDLGNRRLKLPQNVLIKSFFPQRDILAHPNLKAFVTHAGGLSTQEATWHAVPMIGLALFVDQPRNLEKSIVAGVAERVDYLTLSVDSLKSTIKKVAEDDAYREQMKIRSARFRDRPMRPLDTAVWWVEYVLRDPNPEHLKSPALQLNFLAAHSLDVLLIFLAVMTFAIWKLNNCIRPKQRWQYNPNGKYQERHYRRKND